MITRNCRLDESYNEKYLSIRDRTFLQGYDYAVECIKNLFRENVVCYPYLETLLDDKSTVIMTDKAGVVLEAITEWAEDDRNELIAYMIEEMDEQTYHRIKAEVNRENI